MKQTFRRDIERWSAADEGQFFERKSAWDRSGKKPKGRKTKEIAWDIAETICAMANTDGGELVVGMENNGILSGVNLPEDKIRLLLGVPRSSNYIDPIVPCTAKEIRTDEGKLALHFEIPWRPEVHRLTDGRYLLRVGDSNVPFPAEQIAALKAAKSQNLFERSFPPGSSIEDIDLDLVRSLMGSVWPDLKEIEILRRYGLVEGRNGHMIPTLAALLLFGKNPQKWHPRSGLDFIRWEGKESKHGTDLNIAKRFRIETPLTLLIQKAYDCISPFIRERQQLHDLFFSEKLEYPTFAWQEAIVNAVAHRDYSLQGAPVEVWMFDNRLEVRSPGLPPHPVSIEALNRRERVHFSRNPLIVRILTDLKFMRDVGEGIPRIFDEMDRAGSYPPRFEVVGGFVFQITLRNEPVFDRLTIEWLHKFKEVKLSGDQKRILAYAHAHGDRFTSREFQTVIKTDIYGASRAIKDMMHKGVIHSPRRGSRVYLVRKPLNVPHMIPPDLTRLLSELQRKRSLKNGDVRSALGVSRNTASRILKEWTETGWLKREGAKRGSLYVPGERFMHHSQNAPSKNETGA